VRRRRGRSGQRPRGAPKPATDLEQAAGSYQLGASGWAYLAAINQIESNFNQSTLPGVHSGTNADGAAGPMQLGIGGTAGNTWAKYEVDAPDGANPPSVYDETDAVYTAANYLHAKGGPSDWQAALYAYNHAGWYVAQVQQLAQQYAQTAGSAVLTTGAPPAGCVTPGPTTPGPTARILPDGLAAAPQDAPGQVQAAIAAGDRIIDTSYSTERQSNMLTTVKASYDCSGSTDFVLYHAGLNAAQVDIGDGIAGDSGMLENYGAPGPGHWITVYASAGHASIEIAGIALDTTHWTTIPPGSGPRWQPATILPAQLADGTPGPNDTPQDSKTTPHRARAQAIAARRDTDARDRIHHHATGHLPPGQAHLRRRAHPPGDHHPTGRTPS
jgi:Transglycosylase SLT domain